MLGPLGFTAREAWANNPMVNEDGWYKILDALTRRKLLTIQLSEPDRKGGRPKAIYSPNMDYVLCLPDFDGL